jgi:MarR family transcriptional regulator, temperature-dependent positive regulator of motility
LLVHAILQYRVKDSMQKALRTNRGSDWLEQSPTHLVHRVAQCVSDVFGGQTKDYGLTPRQVAVLTTVANNEGLSQTGIVARTGIDRSTLADLVRRLQRKGLLQRRRTKDDARAYAVKLTEEGRRVLSVVEPLAKAVDEQILATLPPKDRQNLINALQSIAATLQPRTRS